MVKKVIQGDFYPTSATVGVTGVAQGVGASGATVKLVPTYHVYKIAAEGTGEVDETQLNNVFTSTPFNIDNAWYKYSTKLSTASSFTEPLSVPSTRKFDGVPGVFIPSILKGSPETIAACCTEIS